MHVISKAKLRGFWERHPDAEGPLGDWYKLAEHAHWKKFADVRADYRSADQVGKFTVFNIGGNKYRLIAAIHFNRGKVFVRYVLTHEEYDAGKWNHD